MKPSQMKLTTVMVSVFVSLRKMLWHTRMLTVLEFFKVFLVGVFSVLILLHSTGAAAAQTIVSLTFDDGLTQSTVRDTLFNHGMKGTFYINSDTIGQGGDYLSKSQLDALVADGNEIGGHTINHVDLATLSDSAQRTAICNDLQTLNNWYPGQIHAFAYPYASTGSNTQNILSAGCPGVGLYTSARTVGGLVSGTQCQGCATAETIPPGNPYYINTPESILSTTTLDQIKTLVTQAETNGGWVPLVFHRVCAGCSDLYAVSPTTLDAFLTWLQARQGNNTVVRTVNEVMTGNVPPPPPPPPLGSNLLINPSLELDLNANNQADCWQRDGFGTNTAIWTRTTDSHADLYAERVQVTAYSSGDLKLIQTLDAGQAAGGCAPTVEAGATYQLGAWYKSTTPVIPVLFYRSSSGVWQYWRDGPLLPTASNWAQMTFNPGAAPAGSQAISFGIALDAVGTLTTDDYSMRRVLPASSDTTPPTVSITAPVAGSTVSGTAVTISASAADNVGVVGVQFRLDGVNLGGEVTVSPYGVAWKTVTFGNGTHTLTALARDAAGNTTTSSGVTITVNNVVVDTVAPTVSITAPVAGTVSGTVTVSASAADNVGVVGVQFKLDGVNLAIENTSAPYTLTWNTASSSNGAHTLTAVARDAAGNTTTSSGVTITVNNVVVDTAAPTVSITAPAAGTISGTVIVSANAADNVGVVGVQFRLDGINLAIENTAAPYTIYWNSLASTNGTHTLTAVARDAAGNTTTSAAVTVTVNNIVSDTIAPTVVLTAPLAGSVTGTVAVSANASDNVGVVGVQFRLDGVNLLSEITVSPYSANWNSTTATNGVHVLTAVARDAAGNTTTSGSVSVTVNNNLSVNLISNPSLEVDADNNNVPDCWQLGGYGTNTVVWSRVAAAHSGSFAESMQITSRSSGDRKLVQTQDSGTCAPAVTPGDRYALSAWYKSTASTGFVVFYRTSTGAWRYWMSSPSVASATNWTQAVYITPALPAGATHLSYGLYLSSVGTLVTDDYAMTPTP